MPEPESVLVDFWYAHPVGHAGTPAYEQAMEGHFARLQACLAGRESLMWSIDGAHRDYVSASFGGRRGEG